MTTNNKQSNNGLVESIIIACVVIFMLASWLSGYLITIKDDKVTLQVEIGIIFVLLYLRYILPHWPNNGTK